jgi:hypothetical protein
MAALQRTHRTTYSHFAREVGYASTLLPAGLGAVSAVLGGRPNSALHRWLRVGERTNPNSEVHVPGRPRLLLYAVLTTLLGVLALIPLGVELLVVLRGVLYGFVDPGPYDHSWGGPSLAGAWLAHIVFALPFAAAAALALRLLAGLHHRMMARLAGSDSDRWVLPISVLLCAGGTALVLAWIQQI